MQRRAEIRLIASELTRASGGEPISRRFHDRFLTADRANVDGGGTAPVAGITVSPGGADLSLQLEIARALLLTDDR